MIYLGENNVLLPCPDSTTALRCDGKIEIAIQSYRIARGRGAFTISVDEPTSCTCNRCGRIFVFTEYASKGSNLALFSLVE